MRLDLRSLCLNSAVVIVGAAFCGFAALDFYITRGTGSPSLSANKAARTVFRAQFWGSPGRAVDAQQLPFADRMAFYRMMILRGGPVEVSAADELALQQDFARLIRSEEFAGLAPAAREQALDWAREDLPNDQGNHVYGIPALKLPSLEARASRGDCAAARRLASYDMFGALGKYDLDFKWARIAAKCPGTYFKETLVGMFVYFSVKPAYEGEIEELIAGIEAVDPALGARYRRDVKQGRPR
ncbi:hypothetical protein [Pseudoduganella sp. R-34]|uniref:hypothetical protein n=1 Tax=Pseudoduganella sp. R-34 TaxID=3404062 RepID=UPI003CED7108